MNLTKRPIFQKGQSAKKSKAPTKAQRERWERVRALGCIEGPIGCYGNIELHHCGTGAGGRKNHDSVAPLCTAHHRGPDGIDGREHGTSKIKWQKAHCTEAEMLAMVAKRLGESL